MYINLVTPLNPPSDQKTFDREPKRDTLFKNTEDDIEQYYREKYYHLQNVQAHTHSESDNVSPMHTYSHQSDEKSGEKQKTTQDISYDHTIPPANFVTTEKSQIEVSYFEPTLPHVVAGSHFGLTLPPGVAGSQIEPVTEKVFLVEFSNFVSSPTVLDKMSHFEPSPQNVEQVSHFEPSPPNVEKKSHFEPTPSTSRSLRKGSQKESTQLKVYSLLFLIWAL